MVHACGAPPHFLLIVRHRLNQTSSKQGIGWRGLVNWPAFSPEFNPMNFWLWGHLKSLMYSASISDLEGIIATGRESLSGKLHETRDFRQIEHIYAWDCWKLCRNAWQINKTSAVEIKRISPMFQQTLFSGRVLTGSFSRIQLNTIPLLTVLNKCTEHRKK